MNRLLVISSAGCLFAYAALAAAMHGPATNSAQPACHRAEVGGLLPGLAPPHVPSSKVEALARASDCSTLLSVADAQEHVSSLVAEYQRPWRQQQTAPRRLYSRAGPRPVPSISAEIQWASAEANPSDRLLLATIAIRAGKLSQSVPCVIDRTSGQASFFAQDRWLAADQWLAAAPLP